jgi:hypothetical protein
MKIYTKLSLGALEAIAGDMGITLYSVSDEGRRTRGKHAGQNFYSLTLRPVTDKYRLVRADPYAKKGYRKVWAVSWQGHWDFMENLFRMDEGAFIQTAIAKYDGLEGFYREAPQTGERNIGSMMEPDPYRTADAESYGLVD